MIWLELDWVMIPTTADVIAFPHGRVNRLVVVIHIQRKTAEFPASRTSVPARGSRIFLKVIPVLHQSAELKSSGSGSIGSLGSGGESTEPSEPDCEPSGEL